MTKVTDTVETPKEESVKKTSTSKKTKKYEVIAPGGVFVRTQDAVTAPSVGILPVGTVFTGTRGVEWIKVKDVPVEDEKLSGFVLGASYILKEVE